MVAGCFTDLNYLIMHGLHVGATIVVYGTIHFLPPKGLWANGTPSVSSAVQCVGILSCQFSFVFGGIQLVKKADEHLSFKLKALKDGMDAAAMLMGFAPMLAVLFIGARIRALDMDPARGHPQKWAQNCFFMCAYALLIATS